MGHAAANGVASRVLRSSRNPAIVVGQIVIHSLPSAEVVVVMLMRPDSVSATVSIRGWWYWETPLSMIDTTAIAESPKSATELST